MMGIRGCHLVGILPLVVAAVALLAVLVAPNLIGHVQTASDAGFRRIADSWCQAGPKGPRHGLSGWHVTVGQRARLRGLLRLRAATLSVADTSTGQPEDGRR